MLFTQWHAPRKEAAVPVRIWSGLVSFVLMFSTVLMLTACSDQAWNNPHPESESGQNIIYSAFAERPKHLDPARSYSSDEARFIDNIYQSAAGIPLSQTTLRVDSVHPDGDAAH